MHQVDWKLTRGKWRPRLLDFAKSHSDSTVKDVTLRAFNLVPPAVDVIPSQTKVKEAIEALSQLKVASFPTLLLIVRAEWGL